eukprot:2003057-Prymnesium_polylepis.1
MVQLVEVDPLMAGVGAPAADVTCQQLDPGQDCFGSQANFCKAKFFSDRQILKQIFDKSIVFYHTPLFTFRRGVASRRHCITAAARTTARAGIRTRTAALIVLVLLQFPLDGMSLHLQICVCVALSSTLWVKIEEQGNVE